MPGDATAPGLLVCLPSQVFGGHERMLVNILSTLGAAGAVRIRVVCADMPQLRQELDGVSGVEVSFGYPHRRGGAWAKLRSLVDTVRAVRGAPASWNVLLAPGVVQVQLHHLIATRLFRRRVGIYVPMCFPARVLGLAHPWLRDGFARLCLPAVRFWITISPTQAQLLRSYWGVRREVRIVPNAVREQGGAATFRDAGSRADGRLRVIFLGRFEGHQKGLDWLCQALRESFGIWAGRIRFDFFGDGPYRGELEKLASFCGGDHLVVHGWTEPAVAFADADVLLLASRFEGVPLVFLEATRHGLAIVSTDFPGAAELLGSGASTPFGDSAELMRALGAMTSREARQQLALQQRASLEAASSVVEFRRATGDLLRYLGRPGGKGDS